jgi:hypothetical protein
MKIGWTNTGDLKQQGEVKECDKRTKGIKEWANGVRELFSFDEKRRKKANGRDAGCGRNGKEIKIRKG